MQIELYTSSYCPFCVRATRLLDSLSIKYTEHVMDDRPAELNEAKRKYGHPTVPIVLVDGELIGGSDDLQEFVASGKLAQ